MPGVQDWVNAGALDSVVGWLWQHQGDVRGLRDRLMERRPDLGNLAPNTFWALIDRGQSAVRTARELNLTGNTLNYAPPHVGFTREGFHGAPGRRFEYTVIIVPNDEELEGARFPARFSSDRSLTRDEICDEALRWIAAGQGNDTPGYDELTPEQLIDSDCLISSVTQR